MSPRFYGAGQPPYYGKVEDANRDLLQSLQKGMNDLKRSNIMKKENVDPVRGMLSQSQFEHSRTYRSEYGDLNLNQLPPYLSMMITNPNAKEDIMNMGMDELESLKQ
jgi:hypothetical protein